MASSERRRGLPAASPRGGYGSTDTDRNQEGNMKLRPKLSRAD